MSCITHEWSLVSTANTQKVIENCLSLPNLLLIHSFWVFWGSTCWLTDITHFFLYEGPQSHDNLMILKESDTIVCRKRLQQEISNLFHAACWHLEKNECFLCDWHRFVLQVLHYGTIHSLIHAYIPHCHMHYHWNTEEYDKPYGSAPKYANFAGSGHVPRVHEVTWVCVSVFNLASKWTKEVTVYKVWKCLPMPSYMCM